MVKKFKCLRCSHCCFFTTPNEYPILLKEEVTRLSTLAKKFNVSLTFKKVNDVFYLWVIEGFCPFYDVDNGRCLIHDQKPYACKMFPLLLNIRTSEISVSLMCDWVAKNLKEVRHINPYEVFPNEMKALTELFNKIRRWDVSHE